MNGTTQTQNSHARTHVRWDLNSRSHFSMSEDTAGLLSEVTAVCTVCTHCLVVWDELFRKLCSYFAQYTKCVQRALNTSHSCATQQRTASWGTIQHFKWLLCRTDARSTWREGTMVSYALNIIIYVRHSRIGKNHQMRTFIMLYI